MATGTSPSVAAATQRNIEIDEVRIPEPLWSVGSRVSWGALVAGGVVALAIYVLLSLLGVALGVVGAYVLTKYLESWVGLSKMLFGVKVSDPLTYSVIAILLTVVAFIACYIPARRATKVDPLVALRYE